MRHLSDETLARMADGPMTEDESAHLESCARCREELAGLRTQLEALAKLPDPPAPPEVWSAVEARLGRPAVRRLARLPRPALQAAAAVLLFAGGILAGTRLGESPAGTDAPGVNGIAVADAPADPAEALRAAEAAYLYALARWVETGGSFPAEDPVGRLAALESILYTTRAALERTPEDPVLGGFYRTALTQREAMITQVDMTMEDEWY